MTRHHEPFFFSSFLKTVPQIVVWHPPPRPSDESSLVSGAQRMQRSPTRCEGHDLLIIWLKWGWVGWVGGFASVNRVVSVERHNVVGCPAAWTKDKEKESHYVYQSDWLTHPLITTYQERRRGFVSCAFQKAGSSLLWQWDKKDRHKCCRLLRASVLKLHSRATIRHWELRLRILIIKKKVISNLFQKIIIIIIKKYSLPWHPVWWLCSKPANWMVRYWYQNQAGAIKGSESWTLIPWGANKNKVVVGLKFLPVTFWLIYQIYKQVFFLWNWSSQLVLDLMRYTSSSLPQQQCDCNL